MEIKEKVHFGKLMLSLLIYVVGYVFAVISLSFLVGFLALLPPIKFLLNLFDFLSDGGLALVLVYISLAAVILLVQRINKNTERTFFLSTFIFGIVFLTSQIFFMIINIINNSPFFINIFGIVFGIGMTIWGIALFKE